MRRFILITLTAWIALPPHVESQDTKRPAHAVARIGTTRYQVSPYRRDLRLSPDGKLLAVSNPIDGVDIWQLPSWTKHHTIRSDSIDPDTEARFACLAFTPDSKKLLLFDASTEQIVVFDLAGKKVAGKIKMPVDGPFHDALVIRAAAANVIVFTWDDIGTGKQAFLVLDSASGKVKRTCKFDIGQRLKKLFTTDGTTLTALDATGTVREFDLVNGKDLQTTYPVSGDVLAISTDGKKLYLGPPDGSLAFYTLKGNRTKGTVGAQAPLDCAISQVGFPAGGKPIALGVRGSTVFLWDVSTGKLLSPSDVPSGAIRQLSFSAKGELFVGAANGHAAWWNPRSAVKLRHAKPDTPAPVDQGTRAISPDGRWRAVLIEKERILISRADGRGNRKPVELRVPDRELTYFTFSPDGRQLACATLDASTLAGPITIYEMTSKKVRLELPGHPTTAIERLAYAPDSALLASAAGDAQVYVWKANLRSHLQTGASRKPTAKDLNDWYQTIAGGDAAAAFQGMIKLAESPAPAARLLADKIAPVPKLDTEGRTVVQWVGDLGSPQFTVRSKANAMLLKLGPGAESELRAVLRKPPELEVKRRVEELLDRIAAAADLTPADILHSRAVEVLEAMGTPEARAVLTRWSAGDPGAVLTVASRHALARLGR